MRLVLIQLPSPRGDQCRPITLIMNHIQVAALALLILARPTVAQQPAGSAKWEITFPATFPANTWLGTHQRLCFGVDGKSLEEVIRDGTNVICGGTNAAGIGFAGGPF